MDTSYNIEKITPKMGKPGIRLRFYFFAAMFIFLIYIRDLGIQNIPFNGFSVANILICLFLNSKERFLFVCLLLPFCRGIPFHEMLLENLCIDAVLKPREVSFKASHIMLVALMGGIEIFNVLYYGTVMRSGIYCIVYLLYISFVMGKKVYEEIEDKVGLFFTIGTISAIISVVVQTINSVGLVKMMTYNLRFGSLITEGSSTRFNANELGLLAIVAAAFSFAISKMNKNKLYYILAIVVLLLGFLSVSRAYILFVALFLVLSVVLSGRKNFITIIFMIALAVGVVYIISLYNNEFYLWLSDFLFERSTSAMDDGFSGRLNALANQWQAWRKSAFSTIFGYGLNYKTAFFSMGEYVATAHIGVQDVLISWGLAGLALLYAWYKSIFKDINNGRKLTLNRMLPFMMCFLFLQTLQFITHYNYVLLLFVSMLGINIEEKTA